MSFDFSPLFQEFETAFKKVDPENEGYRDYQQGGKWVEGSTKEEDATGIIVPLTNNDLRFEQGGIYTRQDVKVYMQDPDYLEKGQEIIYGGLRYRVMEEKPYNEHADFRLYFAKRVTMETEGEAEND